MRCLVTGASGFLGRQIFTALQSDYEVVGLGFRHAGTFPAMDLRDAEAVRRILAETNPRLVIHCANHRDPDFCEAHPDETRALNVEPVKTLCDGLDPEAFLVFISSDYVFDGAHPPYDEEAPRNPINVYGRCKAEAEDLLVPREKTLILRIPLLVGAGPDGRADGFIAKAIDMIRKGDPIAIDDVGIRYPTWTCDVAEAIAFLLRERTEGVMHYSGARAGTKFRFIREIAGLLGERADHIEPLKEEVAAAARPVDSALSTERIRGMGYTRFTDFYDVVRSVLPGS